MLFADAHCHSNPISGMGAREIARRFKAAGGWFMALVALSPRHYGIEDHGIEGYRRVIEMHLSECRKAREEGLRVSCLAGFHPADIDFLVNKAGLRVSRALDLGLRVVDMVADYCKRGLLDGIGEVGRQHYSTKPSHVVAAELVMEEAMARAGENGCVVHLHTENDSDFTPMDIVRRAERIGVPRGRVLLHHSRPGVLEHAVDLGLPASVPGIIHVLREAFRRVRGGFMPESDYIDDPSRPGVVVYPWVMAANMSLLVREELVSEETIYRVNVDMVSKFYGVEPP